MPGMEERAGEGSQHEELARAVCLNERRPGAVPIQPGVGGCPFPLPYPRRCPRFLERLLLLRFLVLPLSTSTPSPCFLFDYSPLLLWFVLQNRGTRAAHIQTYRGGSLDVSAGRVCPSPCSTVNGRRWLAPSPPSPAPTSPRQLLRPCNLYSPEPPYNPILPTHRESVLSPLVSDSAPGRMC